MVLEVERKPAFCTLEHFFLFLSLHYFLRPLEPEISPRCEPWAVHRLYPVNIYRVSSMPTSEPYDEVYTKDTNISCSLCSCYSRSSCLKLQSKNPRQGYSPSRAEKYPLVGRHIHGCIFGEWCADHISGLAGPFVFVLHFFVCFGFHHLLWMWSIISHEAVGYICQES